MNRKTESNEQKNRSAMHGSSGAQNVILGHRVRKVRDNRVRKEKELIKREVRGHIGHVKHVRHESTCGTWDTRAGRTRATYGTSTRNLADSNNMTITLLIYFIWIWRHCVVWGKNCENVAIVLQKRHFNSCNFTGCKFIPYVKNVTYSKIKSSAKNDIKRIYLFWKSKEIVNTINTMKIQIVRSFTFLAQYCKHFFIKKKKKKKKEKKRRVLAVSSG